MIIGSRADLDLLLAHRERTIATLVAAGDEAQAVFLARRLEALHVRVLHGGIVLDDVTERKFTTRLPGSGLLGGGTSASKASEVDDYGKKRAGVCSTEESGVIEVLNAYRDARNVNRTSRVWIQNRSPYELRYKAHKSGSGFFFSDVSDAFGKDGTIPPGSTGGFLHSKAADTACGSTGYVSFIVPVTGRNYVVCVGFSTGYSCTNRAGIEIRVEDGSADEDGNIKNTGHGVNPTGSVDDIDAFTHHVHESENDPYHSFSESTRAFRVLCRFTRGEQAEYHFQIFPGMP